MTLPVFLAHVAARWAVTRTPAHGWVPDESETEMTDNQPKTYRKKPVAVQAMRMPSPYPEGVDPSSDDYARNFQAAAVYDWVESNTAGSFEPLDCIEGREPWPESGVTIDPRDGRMVIATLEGGHWVNLSDYIIRGAAGEFYPCKPEIFHQTYEEAGEQPPARPAPWAAHPARLQQWDTWDDVPPCVHVHGAHGAVQYCKAADGTVSIKGVFIPEWRAMPHPPEHMDELAPFTPTTTGTPHNAPAGHQ